MRLLSTPCFKFVGALILVILVLQYALIVFKYHPLKDDNGDEDLHCRDFIKKRDREHDEEIRQLKAEIVRLKNTDKDQASIIKSLTDRNKQLTDTLSVFKRLEKIVISQELSQVRSYIAESPFLRGYQPRSELEVIPFDSFTAEHVYQIYSGLFGNPSMRPSGNKGREHLEVMNFAINTLNSELDSKSSRLSTFDLVDGITRTDRVHGTTYDLYFRSSSTNVYHRMKLLRPFGPIQMIDEIETIDTSKEIINVIVPLSGRLEKFKEFLDRFVDVCVRWDRRVYLTVVYFGEENRDEVQKLIENISRKENYKDFKIIFSDEEFSRGLALQKGVLAWEEGNVLMFFCDVDIYFTADYLERCRFYSEAGRIVYYPIVFSMYNPVIVHGGSPPPLKDQLKLKTENGFWRDFGYGMTCQYKNDFLNIGGFNLGIRGWGLEDLQLYRRYLRSNMVVVRATDRGIFHLYHPKNCDLGLTGEQYISCLGSKATSEASQKQLGMLAFGKDLFNSNGPNWQEKLESTFSPGVDNNLAAKQTKPSNGQPDISKKQIEQDGKDSLEKSLKIEKRDLTDDYSDPEILLNKSKELLGKSENLRKLYEELISAKDQTRGVQLQAEQVRIIQQEFEKKAEQYKMKAQGLKDMQSKQGPKLER